MTSKFLLFISIFIFITKAYAHPHVFVDADMEIIFNKNQVTSIKQSWKFDEFFSSSIIDDYDLDGNGKFDKEENIQVRDNAFINLENYNFFNNIFFNNNKITDFRYSNFQARINDKKVIYDFTIDLNNPITLINELAIGLYDPEFYVDIAYIEDKPVTFKNNKQTCNYEIKEDTKNPIYMGLVNPKTVYLNCQ